MPNEPAESDFRTRVRAVAYPTAEKADLIWAYLGPPEKQPPVPDLEFMRAPAGHTWVSKTFENCNYLQSMEGGLDTSHSSFLHRNFDSEGLANPRVRSRCSTRTTATCTPASAICRRTSRTSCGCTTT